MNLEEYVVHLTRAVQHILTNDELSYSQMASILENAMAECPRDFEEVMKNYPKHYQVILKEIP